MMVIFNKNRNFTKVNRTVNCNIEEVEKLDK